MKIIFLWSCNGQNVNFPLITNRVVVGTLVLRKIDWFKKLFWIGSFILILLLFAICDNGKHTIFEILMLVTLRIVKPKASLVFAVDTSISPSYFLLPVKVFFQWFYFWNSINYSEYYPSQPILCLASATKENFWESYICRFLFIFHWIFVIFPFAIC